MPYNIDVEQSVLGALLIRPANISLVAKLITDADFYYERHRHIFRTVVTLGDKTDPLTVAELLRSKGELEDAGGPNYIHTLQNLCLVPSHADQYAAVVKQYSVRRNVVTKAIEIQQQAQDDTCDISKILEASKKGLCDIENLTSNYREGSLQVRLTRVNAVDLMHLTDAALSYIPILGLKGIAVRGWAHLVAAYPKVGKTELISAQVDEWDEKVLIISEEPQSIWADRLRARNRDWRHVNIVSAIGTSAREVVECIDAGDEPIVVIDTVRSTLGIKDENDNAEVSRKLSPVIKVCRQAGKTLFLCHHDRKGGGEAGEGISGGHAFFGIVDVAIELRRDKQAPSSSKRFLSGLGRRIQIPELIFERNSDGEFVVLGSPQDVSFDEVKSRALKCLTEEWQTIKDLREGLEDPKPSVEQLRRALASLVKENVAVRDPKEDKKGGTYRWKHLTYNEACLG